MDLHSRGCDTLYREGLDGYIGLCLNSDDVGKQLYAKNICVPELEIVTIIDLTTLWETKQQ